MWINFFPFVYLLYFLTGKLKLKFAFFAHYCHYIYFEYIFSQVNVFGVKNSEILGHFNGSTNICLLLSYLNQLFYHCLRVYRSCKWLYLFKSGYSFNLHSHQNKRSLRLLYPYNLCTLPSAAPDKTLVSVWELALWQRYGWSFHLF